MEKELKIVISAVAKGIGDVRKMGQEFTSGGRKVREAGRVFKDTMRDSTRQAGLLGGQLKSLLAGFAGLAAIGKTVDVLKRSDEAIFNLQSSVAAANREFDDVGSVESWEAAIGRLSDQLLIYSDTALRGAVSRTVDMTKRLGLNQEQMERVIATSADLGAGKVDLEGAIERVTAALRGEAESAEYLGLTLNENYIKAWYEASDAHQKAWKDLSDLEKAQVRYQVLMEQAAEFQGRAAQSAETFGGALALMRKEIENAIAKNEKLVGVLGQVAKSLREHSGEIGAAVADLVSLAATVGEMAFKYRKWIAALVGGTAGFKVVKGLVGVFKGLNAAIIVLTGSGILGWITSLGSALMSVGAAAGLSVAAMAGLYAAAAFGIVQIGLLIKAIYDWRSAAKAAEESQARMIATSDRALAKLERFKDVRLPKDLMGKAPEELKQLQWELTRARDYYAVLINKMNATGQTEGLYEAKSRLAEIRGSLSALGQLAKESLEKPAAAVMATEEQLEEFEAAAKEAYQAAIKEAERYADKVAEAEEKINLARLDAADRLRELTRKTMSEEEAWTDRRQQYDEKLYAAREALRQKDYEQAERIYKQAQDIAAGLAEEVTRTGKGGQEEVARTLEETTQVAKQTYQEATDGLVAVYEAVGEEAAAEHKARMNEAAVLKSKLDEVAAARQAKVDIELTNLQDMERALNELTRHRDAYITIHQRTVEEHSAGGPAGAWPRRRGLLPGFGGGDKIRALLEAGEYIVNKETVAALGRGFFDAINALRSGARSALKGARLALPDIDGLVRARLGGLIAAAPVPALAAGGLARPAETFELVLTAGATRVPLTVAGSAQGARQGVRALENELDRMGLSHSPKGRR